MKFKMHFLNGIVLLNFAGQPLVELKDGNEKPKLRESLQIKSDTYIKTRENEYAIIKINDLYRVTILPKSVFTLEGVKSKGEYNVRSIFVRSGKVHIFELPQIRKEKTFFKNSADQSKAALDEPEYESMKIDSDFFSVLTVENQKLSLLVDSNPTNALLEVCNFGPEYRLDLFNHETPQILKTGEGVQFQGHLNNEGKVAFDLLLDKRKIPQGKWLEKKPCDEGQIKRIQAEVEKNQHSEADKNRKMKEAIAAKKRKDDARFLCHNPYGQLNQCHFILKQNSCQRTRCNAEGKWAEAEVVGSEKNKCSSIGTVKDCGY